MEQLDVAAAFRRPFIQPSVNHEWRLSNNGIVSDWLAKKFAACAGRAEYPSMAVHLAASSNCARDGRAESRRCSPGLMESSPEEPAEPVMQVSLEPVSAEKNGVYLWLIILSQMRSRLSSCGLPDCVVRSVTVVGIISDLVSEGQHQACLSHKTPRGGLSPWRELQPTTLRARVR